MESIRTWGEIGAQVTRARTSAGFTQQQLADRIELSRDAVGRIERGERQLDVLELSRLATATGRSVEWFVARPPERIASHRGARSDNEHVARLEDELEQLARDVELLREIDVLRDPDIQVGKAPVQVDSYETAEEAAREVRARLGDPSGPLGDLSGAGTRLGLLAFSMDIDVDPGLADAAYVRVDDAWGVAVVNGTPSDGHGTNSGRRRFNLAHELGHHVLADEYTADFAVGGDREVREQLINAFTIHLLMPRQGVVDAWQRHRAADLDDRAALVAVAAEYGVSWSAACAQANRFGLIEDRDYDVMRDRRPTRPEYLELGVKPRNDLVAPHLPTLFSQAVLRAFRGNKITGSRAVELLRGTIDADELPEPHGIPMDALRSDFEDW